MSFHGGVIGVVIVTMIFAILKRIDMLKLGDLVVQAVPMGIFFGRLGNFINGELYGKVTDVPWAMVFPAGGPETAAPEPALRSGARGPRALRDPARVLCVWLRWHERPGLLIAAFLALYGAFRWFCELFRDSNQLVDAAQGFSMGMALSVPMFAGAALVRGPCPGYANRRRHELRRRPARRDRRERRITVAEYMARCNAHYYATRESVRRGRRFHHRAGSEPGFRRMHRFLPCRLVAAGGQAHAGDAGRGRVRPRHADGGHVAHDRAACPDLRNALRVVLIETSPALRERQRAVLGDAAAAWIETLDALPRDGACSSSPMSFWTPCRWTRTSSAGRTIGANAWSCSRTACLSSGPARREIRPMGGEL